MTLTYVAGARPQWAPAPWEDAGRLVARLLGATPALRRIEQEPGNAANPPRVRIWVEAGEPSLDALLARVREDLDSTLPGARLEVRYDEWVHDDSFEAVLVIVSDDEERQDADVRRKWHQRARQRLADSARQDQS